MVAQKFISSNLGSYTSYPTPNRYMLDSINTNVSLPWDEYLMYFFGLLLLLAFIVLIVRKTQLLKVQIVFNVLIFSSLFGLFSTVNYWSNQIEIRKRAVNPNDYQGTTLDETIRLYIVILVVAIVLYAFLAWLYKRHLTYPKKK
jgi:carbon starvation protein CstA